MPVIRVEYDDQKLQHDQVLEISEAIQKIVAEVTAIEDVFVYANSSQIKVKVAPIEIWVEMSAQKIENLDDLFKKIQDRLADWKEESDFPQPINLTIIPMQWKFETDI